jgi:lipid-A-disaccharide synthase-like uncharacterized protein
VKYAWRKERSAVELIILGSQMIVENLVRWWLATPARDLIWVLIGLSAQLMFSARFLVQWFVSEKARASVVPEAFWYFSCGGGLMLLAYAIYRVDPVFILGQAGGLTIYARNIYFIWLGKRTPQSAVSSPAEP